MPIGMYVNLIYVLGTSFISALLLTVPIKINSNCIAICIACSIKLTLSFSG